MSYATYVPQARSDSHVIVEFMARDDVDATERCINATLDTITSLVDRTTCGLY